MGNDRKQLSPFWERQERTIRVVMSPSIQMLPSAHICMFLLMLLYIWNGPSGMQMESSL